MARYIDEILQPGEKVLYSTNAHWIFYLPAIAAWIVALALLIASAAVGAVPSLVLLCWAAAAVIAVAARLLHDQGLVPPVVPPKPTSPTGGSCIRPGSSTGAPSR